MVTHAEIIKRTGTDGEIAEAIGVKVHQVRDWRLRDSIPSGWWNAFVEQKYATLNELSDAADIRTQRPDQDEAAA